MVSQICSFGAYLAYMCKPPVSGTTVKATLEMWPQEDGGGFWIFLNHNKAQSKEYRTKSITYFKAI